MNWVCHGDRLYLHHLMIIVPKVSGPIVDRLVYIYNIGDSFYLIL